MQAIKAFDGTLDLESVSPIDNGMTQMENGLDGLMKQAKEMQEKMERLRSEAAKSEVVGESGAGLVCAYVRVARCQIS